MAVLARCLEKLQLCPEGNPHTHNPPRLHLELTSADASYDESPFTELMEPASFAGTCPPALDKRCEDPESCIINSSAWDLEGFTVTNKRT